MSRANFEWAYRIAPYDYPDDFDNVNDCDVPEVALTPVSDSLARPPTMHRTALLVARRVSAAIAVIAGIVTAGILLVTPDGTGFLQSVDSKVSTLAPGWSASSAWPIGAGVGVVALLATVVAVRRSVRNGAWRLAATPAVAWGIASIAGFVVRRPGPGRIGDLTASNATSFPSVITAMVAAGIFASLSLSHSVTRRRFVGAVGCLLLVVLVAANVATRTTWLLDEVLGVLIGWVALRLVRAPLPEPDRSSLPLSRRAMIAVAAVLAAAVLIPTIGSFASAIRASGNSGADVATVDWMRNHGLGPVVDRSESWWLWRHLPSPVATITSLPAAPINLTASPATRLPTAIAPILAPALAGEGVWSVAAADTTGQAQLATTTFRPDPSHPSLVAGVTWFNSATTRFDLIAGTKQPAGAPGAAGGRIPDRALGSLLAAFNSGYKMRDTPGGTLIEGHRTRKMIAGLATLAVRRDGTATVGAWGRDLNAAQGYVALRQNLHLVVDHGQAVSGLNTNKAGLWGTVRNALPTWRSGIGITATGNLVYVGGNNLTLGVLGASLIRAGAVTGMELDIHKSMVTFNLFTHHGRLTGHKLLPDMPTSAARYLTADQRDFVMVTGR